MRQNTINDITQLMPKELWKSTASFLSLKDLENFQLVCKEFYSITKEIIEKIKKMDPQSIYEINEIMEKTFPFFQEHFKYQTKIITALINTPNDIDQIYSETSPLIQTPVKSKKIGVSKNTTIILLLLGIIVILAGAIFAAIDKVTHKNKSDLIIVLEALASTLAGLSIIGGMFMVKKCYSDFKEEAVETVVQHAQKSTHQVIIPAEKEKYEPKIHNFFKKRTEFFNALLPEAKTEVIETELLEQSKLALKQLSEIYDWVCKDNAVTEEETKMMRFYAEKLNEFVADGTLKRKELPKSVLQIMDIYKTITEDRVITLSIDEEREGNSMANYSVPSV